MNKEIQGYRVHYTIIIDHPERRDATYPVVSEGTRLHFNDYYPTQKQAVDRFNWLINGESDFESEYVSKVCVDRMYHNRSPRTVRLPVERNRPDRWAIDFAPALENVRFWSCYNGSLAAYCSVCRADLTSDLCSHVDKFKIGVLRSYSKKAA